MNHGATPAGVDARLLLSDSPAFREASLRTEVRRAWIVIAVALLMSLLVLTRGLGQGLDARLVAAASAGVVLLVALQVCTLSLVRWARARNAAIPSWMIITGTVVESIIPTGIMVAQISSGAIDPYAALVSPPMLANGLMITLTTLRLQPWLCVLAGGIAAAGYMGIFSFAADPLGAAQPTTGLPSAAYVSAPIMLLISGLAAAWVAREIRGHMNAALREEQTRREMARMEQDLAIARTIQQALVPRLAPDIPGFDIAGWNRPADLTGGDYYDWQCMPDGNWIVTLADVSGHGIGPAMVTAACRAYVRASSAHHGDLESLTARINRLLAEDLPEGRFITMVSVLIDPRRSPLALLSAGHGPIALYVGATGDVEDILPQGLPLAVDADVEFGPARSFTMAPGDVLALVTDGFVEWSRHPAGGEPEQFGIERLRQSLRRHAHLAAASMIEAITADVAAFAQSRPQQDDLTMVIIRREPQAS